jgi:glycogen debranching enzyme
MLDPLVAPASSRLRLLTLGFAFILAYAYRDSAMFAMNAGREAKLAVTSHTNMNPLSNFLPRWTTRSATLLRLMRPMRLVRATLVLAAASLLFASMLSITPAQTRSNPAHPLELSRPARPWEFLPLVGKRAALFGDETGRMEAWVYPLKLLREFHLQFHEGGRVVPAEVLARTVVVHPESSTIVYSGDTFTVRETLFVPVNEPGAVMVFDVETEQPLEIEATFVRDFQLEWPAAIGGTYMSWDASAHCFVLGEETRKFVAMVGSSTASEAAEEYQTNYSQSQTSSFRLGVTPKGKDTKIIVMAGSTNGRPEADATYRHLSADYAQLLTASGEYYESYLRDTVSLTLPDAQLQQAYDWSRISVLQGMVTNAFLGTGLVAGYRTSGESARPGFAWFFGRDSLWTSLALDAEGDFANTRTALEFVSKFQRDDGKIPHEIAQTASLVPWFKDFPYGYASADGTPLYLIAVNDYVVQSGDLRFAKEKWDSLWKAYQFLRSTYDAQGFPQNSGVGHGWVEGGPLLPVKTELYQTALGAEALRALANLARLAGKDDAAKQLTQEFEKQRPLVEKAFWLTEKNRYAFALDKDDKPVDQASVLATVPMWFGLLDEKNSEQMISQLADSDHQTDWGMRIISNRATLFSGGGYHYGSVWPLFTGWASVGEYRYHRALPAYQNLRANALLALDGSLGHVTEVLSGDSYQPLSTSSPHQIWSAAMVVSPVLRGMLGLSSDAKTGTLTFAPHIPADWTSFAIRGARAGSARLDLSYTRSADGITLQINCTSVSACPVEFSPALSLRAQVPGAELNGKPVAFHVAANQEDQHVMTRISASGKTNTLKVRVRNDFGVSYQSALPPLGSRSQGLRVLSEAWTADRNTLTLDVAGVAGGVYELTVWNPGQTPSVEGGELLGAVNGNTKVRVRFPAGEADEYVHEKIVFHFSGAQDGAANTETRRRDLS